MATKYEYQFNVTKSQVYPSRTGYILTQYQPTFRSFIVGLDMPRIPSLLCVIEYYNFAQFDELREFIEDTKRLIYYNYYNEGFSISITINDIHWRMTAIKDAIRMRMKHKNLGAHYEMTMSLDEASYFIQRFETLFTHLEQRPTYTRRYSI